MRSQSPNYHRSSMNDGPVLVTSVASKFEIAGASSISTIVSINTISPGMRASHAPP